MTNWNVVVDNKIIVKVSRRLGDGDRAVRLVRAVAQHEPETVPTLYATVELRGSGAQGVVATVTELITDAVDGWTWAVDELDAHLEGSPGSDWPTQVGTLLARVHAALWRETAVVDQCADDDLMVLAVQQEAAQLAAAQGPLAQRLTARLDSLTAAVATLTAGPAPRFSVHGDLHVGQLLRDSTQNLKLIDFDGDPQSAVECDAADAAVDVAHLLVSIDLVGAIVAKRRQRDDPRIIAWCTAARRELLLAYNEATARQPTQELLDLDRLPGLQAAQLVHELTYARDFLPRWSYAADWAITHRYPPRHKSEDPPWTPPASPTT